MVHTVFKTVIRDKGDKRHSQGCLTLLDQRCPRKKGVESEESAAEDSSTSLYKTIPKANQPHS